MRLWHKNYMRHIRRVNKRCRTRERPIPIRLYDVAAHEAAHALMMRLAGIKIGGITIKPRPGARGCVTYAEPLPKEFSLGQFKRWLRIYLAGHLAMVKNQCLIDGINKTEVTFKDEGPGTDFHVIYHVAVANMTHEQAMSLIEGEAHALMKYLEPDYWNSILGPLVQQLFRRKGMSGEEIEAYFDEKSLEPLDME